MNKSILTALVIAIALVLGAFYWINPQSLSLTNKGPRLNLVAGPVVGYVKSASMGKYLTDTKGMTLYVSADDKELESTCTDECLSKWWPMMYNHKQVDTFKDPLSKKINVIQETSTSWARYAYGNKPLYYYSGDRGPGEINGNGLDGGKWSIVRIGEE